MDSIAIDSHVTKHLEFNITTASNLHYLERYYAEACNEWRGPSPRLSGRATQLRRNIATVATGEPLGWKSNLTDVYK